MTDFRYWKSEANKVGLVMCSYCFESKPVADMWTDEDGYAWDVCVSCHDDEQKIMRERGLL